MILKEFYEKTDFLQYPENEYIREKTPGVLLNIGKTWPHMIYAMRSRWWYDFQYLHLKDLLLYNSGVYFSFEDKHYQLELTNDMLDEITADAPPLSFLKVGIYVKSGSSVIVNDIPITLDGINYTLKVQDAVLYPFTPVDYELIGDDSIKVSSSSTPFYFQLIFKPTNLPKYRDFRIVDTFTNPIDNVKISLYSSHLTYIIIQNGLVREITVSSKNLMNVTNLIYQTVDYDYYLNKNLAIKSNHVSLFFKPIFYDGVGDSYIAAKKLQLHLLPVEYTYALYSLDKHKDIISLGSFHRMNPKTNMFLLFKNSIPFPAFTEHTLYKICDSGSGGMTPLGSMLGYDVYDYMMYSYPYQLLLLIYDQTFLTTKLDNLDYDTIYEYVWFDINKIIFEQDFHPIEWKTIDFRNTPASFITDFKREGLVLYSIQKWPKRDYDSEIKFEYVHLPTRASMHFYDPLIFDNDFEIVFYHKAYESKIDITTLYVQRPYISFSENIKFTYDLSYYHIENVMQSSIEIKNISFRGATITDDNKKFQGIYSTNIKIDNKLSQSGSYSSNILFNNKIIRLYTGEYYSYITNNNKINLKNNPSSTTTSSILIQNSIKVKSYKG